MALQQSTQRLRVQSSLAWLRGVCVGANQAADQLLDVPFSLSGGLKPEVIALLTTTTYYLRAFCAIFPSESLLVGSVDDEGKHTFWPLIHALARHGIYAVEEGGQTVNHSALAQTTPFRESSHLAILDALMTAHISSVVTIPRVVKAVRRISTLNAAHELPSTVEEALLLWLRKVSEAVTRAQQHQKTEILQEPDTKQRRTGVQLLHSRDSAVARPRALVEAVAGGQCLAALLVHYHHQEFSFQDFHFKPTQLTQEEASHNLAKFASFSLTNLQPHSVHIDPKVLVNRESISLLHTNILALLARIYDYFEPGSRSEVIKSRPSIGDASHIRAGQLESTPLSQCKTSCFQLSCMGTGRLSDKPKCLQRYEHTPLLPLRQRASGVKSFYTGSTLTGEKYRKEYTGSAPATSHSLLSFPSPALGNKTRTGVTFNPPIISSNSLKKPTAGASLSSVSAPLITTSVDNLRIGEQMKTGRDTGRDREPTNRKRQESGGTGDDAHKRRTKGKGQVRREWKHDNVAYSAAEADSSSEHSDISTILSCNETTNDTAKGITPPFSTDQPQTAIERHLPESLEVHKSFTLDKQHTIASASKAGLPIIVGGHSVNTEGRNGHMASGSTSTLNISGKETATEEAVQHDTDSTAMQIRADPSASGMSQIPMYKYIMVYIPEGAYEEGSHFDQYLMRHVHAEIVNVDQGEETSPRLEGNWVSECIRMSQRRSHSIVTSEREKIMHRRKGWRQRLKERGNVQTNMSQNVAAVTSPHPASIDIPSSQQPPVLTSTTSKGHEAVTAMPLPNDPVTKLPLTPIPAAPPESVPLRSINIPVRNAQFPVGRTSQNPWSRGGFRETFTPITPRKEKATADLQARRQQLLREKLERRQHDRKMAKEHKKRAAIIRDIRALTENASSDANATHVSFSLTSAKQTSPSPAHPPPALNTYTSPQPTPFITHNGPECYVKPSAKSNRNIIRNALCHVCLAGDVNQPAKQRALSELDTCNALHFFILFKHIISFTFRALYSYTPEEGKVTKIFGSGPRKVQEHMVDHLYKYNSGSKEFSKIHSHSFSLSVDAFTLKQEVWALRRSKQTAL